MLFPELREKVQSLLRRSDNGKSLTLGLSTKEAGVGFGTTEIDFLRKYPQIYAALSGGFPAWSGESVTRETALGHPVIWACNGIVAGSIGFAPALLMQKKDGLCREATEHPMYAAMRYEPNAEVDAQTFTEQLTSHCLLSGNAYAKIIRRSGTRVAIGLEALLPEQVTPAREKTGQKRLVYIVKNETGAVDKTYTVDPGKPHDILHIRGLNWDGLSGHSVIHVGRNSMGTAIAADRNVAKFWANGGRIPYLLRFKKHFADDTEFQAFRAEWEKIYSEPHRAPILEDDAEYVQTGLSMVDAQANEFRQFVIAEMCRWFFVNPYLVGDMTKVNYSITEQLALEFVKMTLSRWMSRWEQAFRRCVLTPTEKEQGYMLRHNVREFLRADFKTRMEAWGSALQNGIRNIDEVRDEDDLNPLPNGAGSHYHIQTNMGTLDKNGTVQAPSSLVRLN
jgi:HK97 family phage portal protein